MRKTKYDDFVYYNPITDTIFLVKWDTAWDRVDHWFFCSGDQVFWKKGKFKDSIPTHFVLIDRLPERTL